MSRVPGFALLLLLSGCLVDGLPCHTQGDCLPEHACVGPTVRNVNCGIGPRHECLGDSACPSGEVCHAIDDPCSGGGIGTQCGPPCSATSCGGNFRCNAGGACEPLPCSEGFACGPLQHCASAASARGTVSVSHGCNYTLCTGDSQCAPGQACVNRVCQSGSGTCHVIELRP